MSVLDSMLPVVIESLTDQSDDVRSVAALSLLPVTDALINSVPQQVCSLIIILFSRVNVAVVIEVLTQVICQSSLWTQSTTVAAWCSG